MGWIIVFFLGGDHMVLSGTEEGGGNSVNAKKV